MRSERLKNERYQESGEASNSSKYAETREEEQSVARCHRGEVDRESADIVSVLSHFQANIAKAKVSDALIAIVQRSRLEDSGHWGAALISRSHEQQVERVEM